MEFIGRKSELESLKGLLHKKTSSLVVIRGRRRIGKSRLIEEFAKSFPKSFILSGIPPTEETTAASQREEFLRQLQQYKLPVYRSDDWGDMFYDLSQSTKTEKMIVVFDEITWMGSEDPTFLPKLKTAWDLYFKKNPKLIMVLSGSNSTWIQKNILNSTGFFGRVSLRLLLEELSLPECNAFLKDFPGKLDSYEKFKILAVTGGIPRYLEELRPNLSAEGNLQRLCFDSEGLLFQEFDQIFHDFFSNKGSFYKRIVQIIADHHVSGAELATLLKRSKGGDLSDALEDLLQTGFLARDYTWNLANAKQSTISRYRLRDNYLRFYTKYIEPYKEQIISGVVRKFPQGWHSILGWQFENLVVNNGNRLCKILQVPQEEILFAGPFLQTARERRKGCQIDYLIQTRFRNLYICEVKFKQQKIGIEIIKEVEEKCKALQLPKGFSYRPILIHVNGVDEEVEDSGFFANIVDFSMFLE